MHAVEHEEWCAAIAAGDEGEVPQALRREIASCAACARRIAELREVRHGLSRLAREDRELLAEAEHVHAERAEELIEQRLRGLAHAREPARIARSPWRRSWLVAAAALAVVGAGWLAWKSAAPSGQPHSPVLGVGEHFRDMHPRGEQDPLSPLTWSEEVEQDGWFRVTVRATDGSATPEVVKDRLYESRWTLSADDLAKMPRGAFEWRVESIDGQRRSVRASPWVTASPKR